MPFKGRAGRGNQTPPREKKLIERWHSGRKADELLDELVPRAPAEVAPEELRIAPREKPPAKG